MKKSHNFKYYLAASIALATFLVYISTLKNEFINWDDAIYIYENPHIGSFNADFFKWAFFDFYAGNWHPLTWISHALDYAVWGLDPMGHHLTNNILHALNAFVVVLLVVRLLEAGNSVIPACPESLLKKDSRRVPTCSGVEGMTNQFGLSTETKSKLIAAATTGLLFGLHPIHVESVAWVSERKDLLCALFFMLSIMAYTKYAGRGGPLWTPKEGQPQGVAPTRNNPGQAGMAKPELRFFNKHYLLSLVFFILALLSKPMAITLPAVLLLLDWFPFERVPSFKAFRAAIVEKLPFIALSLVSSVLTILAQSSGGAIKSMVYAPLSMRVFIGIRSLITYLWKTILPVNLIPFYPYPKDISVASLEYFSAIALVGGITISCIVIAKKKKLWLSVWGYYVLNLIPVLGIIQVGEQSMADRYMYLPGLGPLLIMGLMAAWVWERINRLERRNLIAGFLAVAASILVFISLSYLSFKQIGIWKNSIVFWNYIIEKEPERVLFAYLNRGVAFEKRGELNKAIEDYDKVIDIDPLYFEAYNNLGVLYGQNGMFDKAIEYLNKSIGIDPTYVDAYVNRGIAYAISGRYDSALNDFNKAILLDQNSTAAYFNRGSLYLKTGNRDRAASDFRKACDLGKQDACSRIALY